MIGVHLSRDDGHPPPGVDCVQIFLRGPLGRGKALATDEEKRAFMKRSLPYVVVHAPYTVNLARPTSLHFFKEQVRLAAAVKVRAVVVHVGHAVDMSESTARGNLVGTVKEVLRRVPDIEIWIETPAGSGREFCTGPDEMMALMSSFSDSPRVGLCLDTAHVFVAGTMPTEYIRRVQASRLGIGILRGIHLNGSVHPQGSRKDQHAPLGEGHLPLQELMACFDMGVRLGIPVILETPSANHQKEVRLLMRHK